MTRWSWGQILTPIVCLLLVGVLFVFAHSGLSGEHGLGALRQAEVQEAELQRELERLRGDRHALANRVARLDERYLDLDLLDERVRAVLGHARGDELTVRLRGRDDTPPLQRFP